MLHLMKIIFLILFFVSCKTRNVDVIYKLQIEENDTLASIARKYDTTPREIMALNELDSSELHKGQIIYVKPGELGRLPSSEIRKAEQENDGLLFGGRQRNLIWPVYGEVSSEFGMREGRPHDGIDIRAEYGEDIKAAAAGVVKSSGWINGYGKTVVIDHGKFETLYAHCSKLKVSAGQKVRQGQLIGKVGTTGRTSGPHLHFEFRNAKGIAVNPKPYLKQNLLSRNN